MEESWLDNSHISLVSFRFIDIYFSSKDDRQPFVYGL